MTRRVALAGLLALALATPARAGLIIGNLPGNDLNPLHLSEGDSYGISFLWPSAAFS
jgi:hypothetical protein